MQNFPSCFRILAATLTVAVIGYSSGCQKEEASTGFQVSLDKPAELDPFADKPPKTIEVEALDDAPPERRLETPETATSEPTPPASDAPATESSGTGSNKVTLDIDVTLSPLPVVERQFESLQEGDLVEAANDNWIPDDPDLRNTLKGRLRSLSQAANDDELTIEGLEQYILNTWAVVPIKIEATKEGKQLQGLSEQYLVKTEAGWKIAPTYLHGDPKLKLLINADFQAVKSWYEKNEARLKQTFLD